MQKTEPFRDLADVRTTKLRLRAERDRVQDGLKAHLDLVREPAFRNSLMGDALGDMIQSWRPLKSISRMMGGTAGVTSKVLGLALGAKARTPMARALVALASFALPALLERFGKDPDALQAKLKKEFGVSWERVKEYVHERRKAHEEHTEQ